MKNLDKKSILEKENRGRPPIQKKKIKMPEEIEAYELERYVRHWGNRTVLYVPEKLKGKLFKIYLMEINEDEELKL